MLRSPFSLAIDPTILPFLLLDGLQGGLVYGLLALALVLVFAVTRVILVPIGELMMFAPLSLVWLAGGKVPGTVFLAGALLLLWAVLDRGRPRAALFLLMALLLLIGLAILSRGVEPVAYPVAVLLVLAIGAGTYRVFFEPMREGTVLSHLIMAVGLHVAYQGLGLVFFGPEQYRPSALLEGEVFPGLSHQALLVYGVALLAVTGLYVFFRRSLYGKALLACSESRLGARICGVRPEEGGRVAFVIASGVAAVSGLLLAPLINAAYFMGFMLALKAFVAAVLGGLASYPIAFSGALLVGFFESFAAFFGSAYKDALVFLLLLPALFYQSLRTMAREEE